MCHMITGTGDIPTFTPAY